uniref:Uncharacterized protein n=1 Tax=Rhizophora mucronata TaxID=61149 RepID=A0A2P2QAC9_RHIMU
MQATLVGHSGLSGEGMYPSNTHFTAETCAFKLDNKTVKPSSSY